MCSAWSPASRSPGKFGDFLQKKGLSVTRAQVSVAPKLPGFQKTQQPPPLTNQGISLNELHLHEVVEKQTRTRGFAGRKPRFEPSFLDDSYEACRRLCALYAKTFYLGNKIKITIL